MPINNTQAFFIFTIPKLIPVSCNSKVTASVFSQACMASFCASLSSFNDSNTSSLTNANGNINASLFNGSDNSTVSLSYGSDNTNDSFTNGNSNSTRTGLLPNGDTNGNTNDSIPHGDLNGNTDSNEATNGSLTDGNLPPPATPSIPPPTPPILLHQPNVIYRFALPHGNPAGFTAPLLSFSDRPVTGTVHLADASLLHYHAGLPWLSDAYGIAMLATPPFDILFAQVYEFAPEYTTLLAATTGPITAISSWLPRAVEAKQRSLRPPEWAGGWNSFMPFRITGRFTRVVLEEGPVFENVLGIMTGVFTPGWGEGIGIPGTRCTFLGEKKRGAPRVGGEVRAWEAEAGLCVEWAVSGRVQLGIPRGREWDDM